MTSPNFAKTSTVATFEVDYLQFLNEDHQLIQDLPEFATPEALKALYRLMAMTRALDSKAIHLQRTGQMGTYPSAQGQEAVGVGIGHAMSADDVYCSYYRDQAAMLTRGLDLVKIFQYWGGDERGAHYETCREDLPFSVPIATQCLHAAGVAFAIKYREQNRAVVTSIGEGGTSKGDFYEAMNLAGSWELPLVLVVNNNQWAISVPREKQSHAQTIAQKAIAAGIKNLQVDGNDVIALRYAVAQAIADARAGKGPTLIEAVTYRLCDHTTADDAKRYMPHEQRKAAWAREPIARLGYYMEAAGFWSRDEETEMQEEVHAAVDAAAQTYLNTPRPSATDMFDYLYEHLPEAYADQRDEVGGLE